MTKRCHLSAFLAVCCLLAGCGQASPQAQFDKALVDAEVAAVEVRIANDVAGTNYDVFGTMHRGTRRDLPAATAIYIKATRKLSGKDAKSHLADTATQVQGYCASCATAMDRERETR